MARFFIFRPVFAIVTAIVLMLAGMVLVMCCGSVMVMTKSACCLLWRRWCLMWICRRDVCAWIGKLIGERG